MRKYRVSTKKAGAKHYWAHLSTHAIHRYMEYFQLLGYTLKDLDDISVRVIAYRKGGREHGICARK